LHPEDWRPNPVSNHLLKAKDFFVRIGIGDPSQ
jgi:hypothetical protein